MNKQNNPIVFITGASAGIGEACAKAYAAAGAKIIITARRKEKLDALAEQLRQQHQVEVLPIQLDVADKEQVKAVIEGLDDSWKAVDILINNAGLSSATCRISELTIAQIDQMIDVNLKGLLYVTHSLLPQMMERNSGHIINIGSIASHSVYSQASVYAATKHAVKAISQQLRIDLLGTQVKVSQVDPGPVHTEFSEKRWNSKERAEAFYAQIEALQAEDIAEAVIFCTSRKPHVNIDDIIVNSISQAGVYMAHQQSSIFD